MRHSQSSSYKIGIYSYYVDSVSVTTKVYNNKSGRGDLSLLGMLCCLKPREIEMKIL